MLRPRGKRRQRQCQRPSIPAIWRSRPRPYAALLPLFKTKQLRPPAGEGNDGGSVERRLDLPNQVAHQF